MLAYYIKNGLSESAHQSAESSHSKFLYIYKKPYKIRQAELVAERQARKEKETIAKDALKNIVEKLENEA
jgi:hypothetical protein